MGGPTMTASRRAIVKQVVIGLCLAAMAGSAAAQFPIPPGLTPEQRAQVVEGMQRYNAMPDGAGTGAFPAMKEVDPRLPDHTVYRPANLARIGKGKLGVVGWGN